MTRTYAIRLLTQDTHARQSTPRVGGWAQRKSPQRRTHAAVRHKRISQAMRTITTRLHGDQRIPTKILTTRSKSGSSLSRSHPAPGGASFPAAPLQLSTFSSPITHRARAFSSLQGGWRGEPAYMPCQPGPAQSSECSHQSQLRSPQSSVSVAYTVSVTYTTGRCVKLSAKMGVKFHEIEIS